MLRKSKLGRQDGEWTKDQVIAGLLKFYEEFGRFPKASEINAYPYLPTARSIQRNFGGIQTLKDELGIKEDYHKGKYRSELMVQVNDRGREIEEKLGSTLVRRFSEICVHREFPLTGGRQRLDFVVYSKEGRFGIDVFFAESRHSLQTNIQIKQSRYDAFSDQLLLVCGNEDICQDAIDQILSNKRVS